MCTSEKINVRPKMTKSNPRPARPLPNDYNQINDLDLSPKPQRKRKRLNLQKIVCFICVILAATLIVVTYYLVQKKGKTCHSKDICTQPNCVLSAASILKTIDKSVSPCDDFYEFACGHSNDYFHHKPNFFMSQTKYKLNLDLKNLIESLSGDNQPNYIKNLYKFYKSCSDEDSIEKLDVEPLTNVIDELGGWPVLAKGQILPSDKRHHWLNTYIMMRKIGLKADSIVKLSAGTDIKNNSRYIAYIDQPFFNINSKELNNSEHYFKLMVQIAVMMGADKLDAQNELLQVLVFEKELINISLSEDDHRNSSYLNNNYMKVHQIQTLAPNIDWMQYLTEFIGTPVNDNTEVIVMVPSYIKRLDEILSRTKPRVLGNYLIWNVVFSSLPLLSRRWREQKERYFRNTYNTYKDYVEENRWQVCIKQMQKYMPYSLGRIYMKKHFSSKEEIEVISIMNNIRESFIQMLDNNKWMTNDVKSKAEEKALLMELRMGFPKELLDENKMDSIFHFEAIGDNYFKNILNLNLRSFDEMMSPLISYKTNEQINWENIANPADIILKYKAHKNALFISIALLNSYIFKANQPKYLNYGSLGILMGQQMINGFNEIGRLYDENGTFANWWDRNTETSFIVQKTCYEYQFQNLSHSFKGLTFKNRLSFIQRVITDSAAFQQAFGAYKAYVQRNGPELPIPGLDYTPQQLFWINTANTLCWKHLQNDIINISPYLTIKYRINSLMNVNDFSDAFNCPVGSHMNPSNKCTLW